MLHEVMSIRTGDGTVYHIIIHNENSGISVHNAEGHFLAFVNQKDNSVFPGAHVTVDPKTLTNPDPFYGMPELIESVQSGNSFVNYTGVA